jgi:hypothetical protein
MPQPRPRLTPRQTTIALLVVLVVADALAIWRARGVYGSLEWSVVAYSLIFSQVGLAAIWCALGGSSAAQRIAGLLVVNAVSTAMLPLITHDLRWMLVVAMQMAAIYLPLVAVRMRWGIRWRRLARASSGRDVEPFQFTLRQAMIGMTAIAIVFGIVRLTGLLGAFPAKSEWMFMSLLACGFALTALAAAWGVFGMGWIWLRWIIFVVVMGAVAFAQALLMPDDREIVGLLTATQAVLLAVWLWIIRRIGYGLVRDSGNPAPTVMGEGTGHVDH